MEVRFVLAFRPLILRNGNDPDEVRRKGTQHNIS
jgi:hypothetical protein